MVGAKAEHRWAAQMRMVVGDEQVREQVVFTSWAFYISSSREQASRKLRWVSQLNKYSKNFNVQLFCICLLHSAGRIWNQFRVQFIYYVSGKGASVVIYTCAYAYIADGVLLMEKSFPFYCAYLLCWWEKVLINIALKCQHPTV